MGGCRFRRVVRKHDGLELTVTALAAGERGDSNLHVGVHRSQHGSSPIAGSLVLAIRPIQVLPPWQDLNITGGWTPITIDATRGDGSHRSTKRTRMRLASGDFCATVRTHTTRAIRSRLLAGGTLGRRAEATTVPAAISIGPDGVGFHARSRAASDVPRRGAISCASTRQRSSERCGDVRALRSEGRRRLVQARRSRDVQASAQRQTIRRHHSRDAGVHPDQPRRQGLSARLADVRAVVDSRWVDDLRGDAGVWA